MWACGEWGQCWAKLLLGLFHLFWLTVKPCSAKSCSDLTHSFSFIRSTVRSLFPSSKLLSRKSFSKNRAQSLESLSHKNTKWLCSVFLAYRIFLTVTNHLCVTPAFSKSISILIALCNLAKANLSCYPPPISFSLFSAAVIAEQRVIITQWNLISVLLSHMLWL